MTGRQCQPPSREPASDYVLVIESADEREAPRLDFGLDFHDFLLLCVFVIESAGEREASRLDVGFDFHDFLLGLLG